MDKLGVIGNDISTGATATYNFWKHVFQFLLEMITFGYLQFEVERETIPEEKLKDLHGRYLKFKVKHPVAAGSAASELSLTPLSEALVTQDFVENSPEFLSQIEKLNEVWYVFAGLALVMALGAFFIHRHLQHRDSIKVDFSQPNSNYND